MTGPSTWQIDKIGPGKPQVARPPAGTQWPCRGGGFAHGFSLDGGKDFGITGHESVAETYRTEAHDLIIKDHQPGVQIASRAGFCPPHSSSQKYEPDLERQSAQKGPEAVTGNSAQIHRFKTW